jgi:hypothetical protein
MSPLRARLHRDLPKGVNHGQAEQSDFQIVKTMGEPSLRYKTFLRSQSHQKEQP